MPWNRLSFPLANVSPETYFLQHTIYPEKVKYFFCFYLVKFQLNTAVLFSIDWKVDHLAEQIRQEGTRPMLCTIPGLLVERESNGVNEN